MTQLVLKFLWDLQKLICLLLHCFLKHLAEGSPVVEAMDYK